MHKITAIFLLVLLLSACGSDGNDPSPEQAALNQNRDTWNAAAITDYVFTYSTTCFCAPEESIVITVVNNTITDAFFTPSGMALSPDRVSNLRTVDEFFALVQESIDAQVAVLTVNYNSIYGYPESIFIDQSTSIADEEISYGISNLQ